MLALHLRLFCKSKFIPKSKAYEKEKVPSKPEITSGCYGSENEARFLMSKQMLSHWCSPSHPVKCTQYSVKIYYHFLLDQMGPRTPKMGLRVSPEACRWSGNFTKWCLSFYQKEKLCFMATHTAVLPLYLPYSDWSSKFRGRVLGALPGLTFA